MRQNPTLNTTQRKPYLPYPNLHHPNPKNPLTNLSWTLGAHSMPCNHHNLSPHTPQSVTPKTLNFTNPSSNPSVAPGRAQQRTQNPNVNPALNLYLKFHNPTGSPIGSSMSCTTNLPSIYETLRYPIPIPSSHKPYQQARRSSKVLANNAPKRVIKPYLTLPRKPYPANPTNKP